MRVLVLDLNNQLSFISGPGSTSGPGSLRLARPDLPIFASAEQILSTVEEHSRVSIIAQTGSGKTTGVSEILLDAGYDVTVVQPRRLPAAACARYMAHLRGEPLGKTIGFCHALERAEGPHTRLRYVTDGFEFVKSLFDPHHSRNVLVLDELHEWNLHQEGLLGWALNAQREGRPFKLVIMSATLDTTRLSQHLGGMPVIDVPGRTFPIEDRKAGASVVEDTAALVAEQRDVLIFAPGKREIRATIQALEEAGIDAEILPLHGQLSPAEQNLVFQTYERPTVIVSTNIAQTSLTLNVDAVIDSGLERRVEVVDGVETLDIQLISHADAEQRRGRAGRIRPGIYIWHGEVPRSSLRRYPIPEIHRLHLGQIDLRFSCAGLDMERLDFFHQPPRPAIHEGRKMQKALGARSPHGIITPLGRDVASLPVDIPTAVMLVHASLHEPEIPGVLRQMVEIAAVLEANGITAAGSTSWRRFCPSESDSDLFAQLAVFRAAHGLTEGQLEGYGVRVESFNRARGIQELLQRRLNIRGTDQAPPELTDEHRQALLESIWAGMIDQLHRKVTGGGYSDGSQVRQLSKSSVVENRSWVVGLPLNIGVGSGELTTDTQILPLLTFATAINPRWVDRNAPPTVRERRSRLIAPKFSDGSKNPEPQAPHGRENVRKSARPFRAAG